MSDETRSVTAEASQQFMHRVGGAIMVVLALIALGIAYYHPGNVGFFGPVVMPIVISIAVGVAGAAVASGQLRLRSPQDFFGGAALVALAVVAMLASLDLPGMRGFAFGPGTAPRLFATLLAGVGGAVSISGFLLDGPPLQHFAIRGPLFLTAAVFCFAGTIRPLGLVAASYLTILVSAGATPEVRWHETAIWGVILTIFCAVLFTCPCNIGGIPIPGLNLPMQLFPRF